ncbi:MAG: alpha/beta fold hydrolase [Thermodesulfobacteriota bacterium]|nr:alpha/beta fold hydrolase [Thermodesulfobacteriota bacterium]
MKNTTIFIHGQESSSQGTKGIFFRNLLPEMIIPDFSGDVSERMLKLEELLRDKKEITMIGSSLGGLMAALYSFENKERIKKLILLAPAINLSEFNPYLSKTISMPVYVFHGREDEIIPIKDIQDISRKVFTNLNFSVLDDDHRLSEKFTSIDWSDLLKQ